MPLDPYLSNKFRGWAGLVPQFLEKRIDLNRNAAAMHTRALTFSLNTGEGNYT
jgi:hypothetical protein